MLSRALNRSLQSPGLRTRSATPILRLPSSQWSRSMARHNKPTQAPGPAPKKPIDFSKSSGASSTSKVGGASAAINTAQQKQQSPSARASEEDVELPVSEKQAEFKTSADPSQNTANLTDNASPDAPSTEPAWTGPLPDLTKGIPSTLDFELNKAKRASLNLTEAEDPDAEAGGSGRAKGELPASAYVSSSEKRRLKIANYMYATFAGLTMAGLLYMGRNWETEEEEKRHEKTPSGWGFGLMWDRAKARWDDQLGYYTEPTFTKLLPDPDPMFARPYTLVISLEDLLIHSEWSREHGWRLAKRPGMDYFLRYLSNYYELVLWTSQPFNLVEGVLSKLDPYHIITWPLFREATRYENGEYVKDLSFLNRDLSKVIMVDTVPAHAKANPQNSIIIPKWKGELGDKELVSLIPFLEYVHVMNVPDVRKAIQSFEGTHIPTEFAKREAVARKKFEEQLAEQKKKAPKRSGFGALGKSLGIKHQNMMVDPSEMTPAEAFAQGKMLQDLAREVGQKRYEELEKNIRENGEKWLKEEAEMMEKAKEEQMKAMKSGVTGFFGSPGK